MAAGVAAAIVGPAGDAVYTTPRRVLLDTNFLRGRILGKVFAVIRQAGQTVLFDVLQSVGKRHVAVRMMMAISFAVGRHVHELRGVALRIEAAEKTPGKILSAEKQFFESD